MNEAILDELKWLYTTFNGMTPSCSPDIEVSVFHTIIDHRINKFNKRDPRYKLLTGIKDKFTNVHTMYPDICIGDILDECITEASDIFSKKDAFSPLESKIIGALYMKPQNIANLYWGCLFDPVLEESDFEKAMTQLSESGYVFNDGDLHLTDKIFKI